MPKLPANYVKAPSFDNPLRSTAEPAALVDRRLSLRLDETTWDMLQAASKREGVTPEALVQRALDRYFSEPGRAVVAPRSVDGPKPTLRAQLVDQLHERLVRRRSVQFLLSLRDMLRTSRA